MAKRGNPYEEANEQARAAMKGGRTEEAYELYCKAARQVDEHLAAIPDYPAGIAIDAAYIHVFAGRCALDIVNRRGADLRQEEKDRLWESGLGHLVGAKYHMQQMIRRGVDMERLRGAFLGGLSDLRDPIVERLMLEPPKTRAEAQRNR
jgi:hypothetical protein